MKGLLDAASIEVEVRMAAPGDDTSLVPVAYVTLQLRESFEAQEARPQRRRERRSRSMGAAVAAEAAVARARQPPQTSHLRIL